MVESAAQKGDYISLTFCRALLRNREAAKNAGVANDQIWRRNGMLA